MGGVLRPSGPVVLLSDADLTVPADTVENVLATISCPALSPTGIIRIWQAWTYTNNANNKTIRNRLGGASGTVIFGPTRTTQLSQTALIIVSANKLTNSQHVSGITQNGLLTADGIAPTDYSVDLSVPFTIVLSGQKTNSADSLVLQHVHAELVRP